MCEVGLGCKHTWSPNEAKKSREPPLYSRSQGSSCVKKEVMGLYFSSLISSLRRKTASVNPNPPLCNNTLGGNTLVLQTIACPWFWLEGEDSATLTWKWTAVILCRSCHALLPRRSGKHGSHPRKKCKKCGYSYYCSTTCQQQDYRMGGAWEWKSHALMCKKLDRAGQETLRDLRKHRLFYCLIAWFRYQLDKKEEQLEDVVFQIKMGAEKATMSDTGELHWLHSLVVGRYEGMYADMERERKRDGKSSLLPSQIERSMVKAAGFQVALYHEDRKDVVTVFLPKLNKRHDLYIASLDFQSAFPPAYLDRFYDGELRISLVLREEGIAFPIAPSHVSPSGSFGGFLIRNSILR